jgi:hypothetical protein
VGTRVVAFVRRAYKKTPSSRPWWQDETYEVLGTCKAESFNAAWITRQVVPLGSRREEKPAFHLRRKWVRTDVDALGTALAAALAAEVERLMPLLREIWDRSF